MVKSAAMKFVVARTGGLDLSKLDRVPDRLAWPLLRDGVHPTARLTGARSKDPVQRFASLMGLEMWLITGYEEAREVLGNVNHSTDIRPYMGSSGDVEKGDIGGLGFTDPPEHTRQRKLLTPEFTMRRLARLKAGIDDVITEQLDETEKAFQNDGVADLAQTFAFPVPFRIICDLLGLPVDQREKFRKLSTARFDVSMGGAGAVGAISGSREFLLAETARQRHDPGPGLIGQIIRDNGSHINDFDLGGLADGAFNGGMETSASMLALGAMVLLQNREIWDELAGDPSEEFVENVVEELLRQLAVVQIAFPRFAREDVVVGGHRIKKGSVMLVHLPTASRDPLSTPGEAMCPVKESSQHLAFGHGLHRCVGAELARMELRAAYPALAQRFPDMRLAVDPDEIEFHAKSIVFGLESLPVTLA